MSSPIFDRLSAASTNLVHGCKQQTIDGFAQKAADVASAVENFFDAEPPSEAPSLIGRVTSWVCGLFGLEPVARAVSRIEVEALRLEESSANAIVSEAKAVIAGKLFSYVTESRDLSVPFNLPQKEEVLSLLRGVPHEGKGSIFSTTLDNVMTKLKDLNETNNTVDWGKVLNIVRSLHRITIIAKIFLIARPLNRHNELIY